MPQSPDDEHSADADHGRAAVHKATVARLKQDVTRTQRALNHETARGAAEHAAAIARLEAVRRELAQHDG